MPIQKRLQSLIFKAMKLLAIATILVSCSTQSNSSEPLNQEAPISQPTNTPACLAMNSRNWLGWIDRPENKEPKLNISGEVDLPTPGYTVTWIPGILDRRQPPTQNLSISFKPPQGIVIQVVTPTKVSFTMPSEILEYRSLRIYCEDQVLADIPGVKAVK